MLVTTKEELVNLFRKIIDGILNPRIKAIAEAELQTVPEYFWEIPASSIGKYHPEYALGTGGLARHTLAAIIIAKDLFELYNFPETTKEMILVALLFHDKYKQGLTDEEKGMTKHEHPLLAGHEMRKRNPNSPEAYLISLMIDKHMGKFTTSKYSDVVLPIPTSVELKFVHCCDFLASRKNIEIKFE